MFAAAVMSADFPARGGGKLHAAVAASAEHQAPELVFWIRGIQALIDKMNAIHWKGSREKFRTAHQGEIDLYYTSMRILKQNHGVTKIDIPAWQQEQDALRENEKALSDEYKSLRGKLNEMRSVQYCVETAQKNESRKMQKRNRELQR